MTTTFNRIITTKVLAIASLLLILSLSSNVSGATLQEANLAYNERNYSSAVDIYTDLIIEKGYSASLLYNLANSYAQLGLTGKAVVNYQRAHRLSPYDPDIKRNMEVVLKEAGLFDQEQPFLTKAVGMLTLNQWCAISLLSLVVLTLLFAAYMLLQKRKLLIQGVSSIFLSVFILTTTCAFFSYQNYDTAVLITADNPLLISPFPTAASTGSIKEGRVVKVLKEHEEYALIEDDVPRNGWVPKASIEAIIELPR